MLFLKEGKRAVKLIDDLSLRYDTLDDDDGCVPKPRESPV